MHHFRILLLLLLLSPLLKAAKPCTIEGYAKGFEGQIISLHTYEEYITMAERKLGETVVEADGHFEFTYEAENVERVFVRYTHLRGFLFAEPGRLVRIMCPPRDSARMVNMDVEYETQLTYFTEDSTDMNFLAIDFNMNFQKFWNKNFSYFVDKSSYTKLDSFHTAMRKHYTFVKNPYFMPWMEFTFASMEDATFHSEKKLAKNYLIGKKIYYNNNEYMNFFNSFFEDYMYTGSIRKEGAGINPAINVWVSYDSLMKSMKTLRWLENDTLRELVMLKGLFECYNNPAFIPRNILSLAQQTTSRSRVPQHREIARRIVAFYTKLKAGSMAAHFEAIDKTGKSIDPIAEFAGKPVYLFFFSEWNTNAQNEMRLMSELHKRYGKKMTFVAVSVGNDTLAWKKFLRENPKYNWVMLHYNFDERIKNAYSIYATPLGFFIDEEGRLLAAPAELPSGGELEPQIYKLLNPRAAPLRVGER
ncbi:MAG: TlpA family protein disulfide reductase [Bacteroidia bacterium]|jgi:peroxiredoxin|nr:TlpA family protein disulfide reductase [Bacteroidia bacterium]